MPEVAARLRVEPCGGLVEKNDFGIVDQGKRQCKSLLLAAGEFHVVGVAFVLQRHQFQKLIDTAARFVVTAEQLERFADLDFVVNRGAL